MIRMIRMTGGKLGSPREQATNRGPLGKTFYRRGTRFCCLDRAGAPRRGHRVVKTAESGSSASRAQGVATLVFWTVSENASWAGPGASRVPDSLANTAVWSVRPAHLEK